MKIALADCKSESKWHRIYNNSSIALSNSSFGFVIRKQMASNFQSVIKKGSFGFVIRKQMVSDLQSAIKQKMGLKNQIHEGYTYYMTLTVVDWVDVFTRPIYKQVIIDSLKHCQKVKGLEIYGWVLMSNHLHLLASATVQGISMSDILRDFKKFTSKKIVQTIQEESIESRKDWMLYRFEFAGKYDPKIKNYRFWQEGNEAKEIHTIDFLMQKLNYIHENPVRADIVEFPEDYLYSSARNYARKQALLDVVVI